jgi:imidazoleglycerol-phosphate dehydratase
MTAGPGRRAVAGDPTGGAGVVVDLVLDGEGRADVSTGDAFLDHLLELAARHARFDLTITRADARAAGGSVVESIAGALGRALAEALGDERGVRRSGSATMPFDEALALVALDLSGRPYLAYDIDFAGVRIDEFDADLARRFLRALVEAAGITLHVRLLSGSDPHHIVDAVFEGLGEALRTACESLA